MFIDYAKIHAIAGDGGDGCVSFRREKFVPRGGPDGGDGGDGGDVYIEAKKRLHTLTDVKYQPHVKAGKGKHGKGKKQHGKKGKDAVIKVPRGTVVKLADDSSIIVDLKKDGERVVVARGGKGGRGNTHFASPTNRAPRDAEQGEPGEERTLVLELKLLADVGLVGFPNAGKSTFLASITPAHPKIAAYPFTTLKPNLGVYIAEEAFPIVYADIPGIIEEASKGVGLGDRFLRHIERTRLLVFFVFDDSGVFDPDDLEHQFKVLRHELEEYSENLVQKPFLVAINKIDLAIDEEYVAKSKKKFEEQGIRTVCISSLEKRGLQELNDEVVRLVRGIEHDEERNRTGSRAGNEDVPTPPH